MATRTISVAGGNWNAIGAWDEGIAPVNGDAVVARGGGDSGQVTVNVASACTTMVLTNYAATMTFNATLTVAGTVTFVAAMTIAGTSDLICNTTATLTSGGKTLSGGLQLKGTSQTYTMGDAWSVTGLLTLSGTTAITITSNTITVAGGVTVTTNTSGTGSIKMTGGSWTGAGTLKNNLEFAGNVTLLNGTLNYNTGTLLYTSGTITTTGNTLTCILATTFNTGTMNWNNISLSGTSQTYTLSSALNLTGLLTLSGTTAMTFAGAFGINTATLTTAGTTWTWTLSGAVTATGLWTLSFTAALTLAGNFDISVGSATFTGGNTLVIVHDVTVTGLTTISAAAVINGAFNWNTAGLTTTSNLSGTTKVVQTGGTWTGAAGSLANNCNIAGNVTLSGTIIYLTGTLTYVSGTVTPGTSTFSLTGACTLSGGTYANVTIGTTGTITITAAVTFTGTITMPNTAMTWGGTAGWTCATLTTASLSATRIHTFVINVEYIVTGTFSNVGTTAAIRHSIKSSSGGTKTKLTLEGGATQDLLFADPTDIDSSRGQTVYTTRGTITTSTNWSATIGAHTTAAVFAV